MLFGISISSLARRMSTLAAETSSYTKAVDARNSLVTSNAASL